MWASKVQGFVGCYTLPHQWEQQPITVASSVWQVGKHTTNAAAPHCPSQPPQIILFFLLLLCALVTRSSSGTHTKTFRSFAQLGGAFFLLYLEKETSVKCEKSLSFLRRIPFYS
jgi:hypothetical protein